MYATHQSTRILRPVRPFFIWATLFLALFLSMLPPSQWVLMPDWVMLTLAFWSLRAPYKLNLLWTFVFGIFMDVANGSALGQHSLAYVLLGYAATHFSQRLLWFPLVQQALYMLPLFFLVCAIQIVIRMIAGSDFPGWAQFISPFVATLLWPVISFLLLIPQYLPEHDENRPI